MSQRRRQNDEAGCFLAPSTSYGTGAGVRGAPAEASHQTLPSGGLPAWFLLSRFAPHPSVTAGVLSSLSAGATGGLNQPHIC